MTDSTKSSDSKNPLRQLEQFGQAPWLDSLSRKFTRSGGLKKLIDEDGLKGVTSNPSIFKKAIGESSDYDSAMQDLLKNNCLLDANDIYETLAVEDIQEAADVLLPVYRQTQGRDGYVSLEVSPVLALETENTLAEARHLWKRVSRPNVMIKVPGTSEGVPAFKALISEGVNVNVTLLFSQERYQEVAEAYVEGLEAFVAKGGDLSKVASVASFFVSRIDTAVDKALAQKIEAEKDPQVRAKLTLLVGKIAIANAKMAYKRYQEIFSSTRWKKLALQGARSQRVLWASTGTKNPEFKDTLYVEELIGKDTVNTMPEKTMNAFRDHGELRDAVVEDVAEAEEYMTDLKGVGISIDEITDQLTTDGIRDFVEPFDFLMGSVEKKRQQFLEGRLSQTTYATDAATQKELDQVAKQWQKDRKTLRIWQKDASVWTNKDEAKWLGWLDILDRQTSRNDEFKAFAEEVRKREFDDIALLGMGGSSLCVEVLGETFAKKIKRPTMHILDSTDPVQISTLQSKLHLEKTLFVVSSKSGTTLEPNIYFDYFFDQMKTKSKIAADKVPSHFIAITDPGSALEAVAKEKGFWKVFHGDKTIGGRYSALSNFGIVPAAAYGIDVKAFLESATLMERSCSKSVPADFNPGVKLGIFLGTQALQGRDKVTFACAPEVADLGAWLEQLIAESTGKIGKGLFPLAEEAVLAPEFYGKDRVFVFLNVAGAPEAPAAAGIQKLQDAGHPVVRITLPSIEAIGQEFFRWEMATAVAGSLIGINPFDQPDVEASKIETKKLTAEYEKAGSLPAETPIITEHPGDPAGKGGIKIFANDKNKKDLLALTGEDASFEGVLRAHLSRIKPGDYFGILAYVARNAENIEILQGLRTWIQQNYKVATCLGFGPRFLHSTGQAYKGGTNEGVFLQITSDDLMDLPVPGHKFTFSVVKAAQARGDLAVLNERDRRVIRLHLGKDIASDMKRIRKAFGKGTV